jgi:methyl-accepting chemotaxis protein
VLSRNPRVVFCAAVDRNGYLPTHNTACSQPQRRGEREWNTANSRNRRIFNDVTGTAAARSRESYLVQTYRRDMGGGTVASMKDVSAPIYVKGKHWGALRMGCKA